MVNRKLPRRLTSHPALRVLGSAVFLLLALFAATPASAQLRNYDLRFRPPADARVIGFHVYLSANSMSYADYRDDINFIPTVDSTGAATYRLTNIEAAQDVFITLRSYDAAGAESSPSNEIVVAAQAGACTSTSCNDNNPCTTDVCTATGCTFTPATGQTCNDGNSLTSNDMCTSSGTCQGTAPQCATSGCNDNNPCTTDACTATGCTFTPATGQTCNDGNSLSSNDRCTSSGSCQGTLPQCATTGCNDNNSCTTDTCTATGCAFTPGPAGQTCNDGNSGTFNDMCTSGGACQGTVAQCNVDADCGASSNQCMGPQVCSNHMCVAGAPKVDGTTCNDGNTSTKYDICESGTCRGYACGSDANCSDGEACNGAERCVNRTCVAGTPMVCGDGNMCNGTETCSNSTCQPGTAMACPTQDGPCFDAFCDPATGCGVSVHPDGSACTTTTTNLAGMCASGVCVADATAPPVDQTRDPRATDSGTPTTCEMAFGAPTDIHQALTSSPETSRKLVWSAPLHPMGSVLEYRADYVDTWTTLRAFPESSNGCDATWSVTLTGLKTRTRYYYRVSGASADGRVWSETLSLRTSSVSIRDRFKFAFFASNGVDGTMQSPQADEVVTQIKKGGFPLVLGGGGYALSNEAIAAGIVPDATTAVATWKEQARPVTGNSIFVPVLGDTEIESATHAERAADYAEFMSGTTATAASGSYSFDYSGVHFVGLAAPNLLAIHPGNTAGAAQLAWLDANLAAARAKGTRWIVVYLHTDVFTSERNDPNQGPVRTALGNILQRYGVSLVLSGEGDSYERTRALRGNLANPTIGALSDRVTTATDGVVFMRAGSGGRTAFGQWLSARAPTWSAFRDNTSAVFLSIVAGDRNLVITATGLDATGLRVAVDQLEIR